MTPTENQTTHADNANHHYVQALHEGLDLFYQQAVQAAVDALHTEALAEDTARDAVTERATIDAAADEWLGANDDPTLDTAQPPHHDWRITDACYAADHSHPVRAYWLDEPLLSGMFTAMTHRELHDEYGHQEIIIATGDYAAMFDLH